MTRKIMVVLLSLVFLVAGSGSGFAQESESLSALESLLSDSGKLIPDVESNSIMVIDYASNISLIEDYLKMADVPTEQILIEAKVVEVQLDSEHSFGVNWALFANEGLKFATLEAYGVDSLGGAQNGLWQSIPYRQPKWPPNTGDSQTPFTLGLFNEHIDTVVRALATEFHTEILSAPKISTINNRRAKIDVIKTVPYLEKIEEETKETDSGTTTKLIYTYNYADEGVSLEVLPLLNSDDTITLTLCPQVKEIVRWRQMVGPAGAAQIPELPETDVRIADTKVTVKEGQTLVIGGLIRNKVKKGCNKVPLLGDIPFLGGLFRNEYESNDKTELLIFVSPRRINKGEVDDLEVAAPSAVKVESYDFSRVERLMAALENQVREMTRKREALQRRVASEVFGPS